MVSNFYLDLEKARRAEEIVMERLAQATDQYTFTNVANERQYYNIGDIRARAADGKEIFIEVKDDSRIADTHNLLCEEEVFYNASGEFVKGNFYSNYQIYAVVSQAEQKIYIMDFSILKQNYKSGSYKAIRHFDQTTYCYLCPLAKVRAWGAMIAELDY